jgi:uncharacterized protein HemX
VNPDRERALFELTRRNLFWVCLLVFVALGADSGFRLFNTIQQRRQLAEARLLQAQNIGRLREVMSQAPQIEARLQSLSLDLLQVARTNAAAAQIVQDFRIQWNPGSGTSGSPMVPPPAMPVPQPAKAPTTPARHAPAAQ